jgi:hypothetical protein
MCGMQQIKSNMKIIESSNNLKRKDKATQKDVMTKQG